MNYSNICCVLNQLAYTLFQKVSSNHLILLYNLKNKDNTFLLIYLILKQIDQKIALIKYINLFHVEICRIYPLIKSWHNSVIYLLSTNLTILTYVYIIKMTYTYTHIH